MLTDRWSTSEKVSENGDYVVVDTSSLNGTYVNRKPVESVPPANGDEIQMGKFPSGVPHPAHDALTSTRLTPTGRLRNARQTGCSRRSAPPRHRPAAVESLGRYETDRPNQPLSKHKSRLPETHGFL